MKGRTPRHKLKMRTHEEQSQKVADYQQEMEKLKLEFGNNPKLWPQRAQDLRNKAAKDSLNYINEPIFFNNQAQRTPNTFHVMNKVGCFPLAELGREIARYADGTQLDNIAVFTE